MAKQSTKKRKVVVEAVGEAHISASFNNLLISLTNKKGDVISWSSAGKAEDKTKCLSTNVGKCVNYIQ